MAKQKRPFFRWSKRESIVLQILFYVFFCAIVAPIALIFMVFEYFRTAWRAWHYVPFDGTPEQFERAAMQHAPLSYRWFGRTLTVKEVDDTHANWSQWEELKSKIKPGDKIWPFTINPNTLAMRKGFIVVRNGKPVDYLVTISS